MRFLIITSLFLLFLTSCKQQKDASDNIPLQEKPLNVILMIGDGMGLSAVSSSFYYKQSASNFSRFKYIGLINTSSASSKITDSGAGGTAFSTGVHTYNGAIGVSTDTTPVKNLPEILHSKGYKTGIVVTCQVTHATPAAFFAHVASRNSEEEIATQLAHSPIDFIAGGGTRYFAHRIDGMNYLDTLRNAGFEVDTSQFNPGQTNPNKRKAYLLAYDAMPPMTEGRGGYLKEATQNALSYLSNSSNGFFLMIEGSQIDWGGHANDAEYLITEQLDFDETLGLVLDYAEQNENTLVIVLADHETGGFTLASGKNENNEDDYNIISPAFSTHGHSASLIPVFAYGKGAENFMGIYENTGIFFKILQSLPQNNDEE